MKVICPRNNLNTALSAAMRAVPNNSPIPILEYLLVEAKNDKLFITGYDNEIAIEYNIECDVINEGKVLVNGERFSDIIKHLSDDVVSISTDNANAGNMNIECGTSFINIVIRQTDSYPSLPSFTAEQKALEMPQHLFREMINQTAYAASDDKDRGIMQGVKITAKDKTLVLVGIDGYRIALRREHFEDDLPQMDFVIPKKALIEISRIIEDSENTISIQPANNFVFFETTRIKVVSRLLEGEYMKYEASFPREVMTEIEIDKRDFENSVGRAFLLMNDTIRRVPIVITSEENKLIIRTKTEIGSIRDELDININGEPIDADYDPKYFREALRVLKDERVRIEFSGTVGPCLIKPVSGDSFIYLLLPLRR